MFPFKRKPDPVQLRTTIIEPPVTSPVSDLCADIQKRPGSYRFDGLFIQNKQDDKIYLSMHSASGFVLTDAERALSMPIYSSFKTKYGDEEERRSADTARADLSGRLAKLKAESSPETSWGAYLDNPPTMICPKILNTCIALVLGRCPSDIATQVVVQAARQMLPVFEGTHGIVRKESWDWENLDRAALKEGRMMKGGCKPSPTTARPEGAPGAQRPFTIETHNPGDPRPATRDFLTDGIDCEEVHTAHLFFRWPDKCGRPHRTRAEMRAADKLIEAKRRDQKAGAL